MRNTRLVLGAPIDALSWEEAIQKITHWAAVPESRYICLCNVHSVVTASRDADFMAAVHGADLCAPDGAPVAWALRWLGIASQQRINGPDLMWKYLAEAEHLGQKVFFYGSTEATLAALQAVLSEKFPRLAIAGMYAPPFRRLTEDEERQEIERMNRSGAGLVFVGLGCPKQEKWMAARRDRIRAVLVGVGAAFDYHAGTLERAPAWMQHHGLEWLYRLAKEPRRLFRRYAVTNTLFVYGFMKQMLRHARTSRRTGRTS